MATYISAFREIDRTMIALAGGKGANLGELMRINEIQVPDGFCITTAAFRKVIEEASQVNEILGQLSQLKPEDRDAIRELSTRLRKVVEEIIIPEEINAEIIACLSKFKAGTAFAIRSSATAEDLPGTSFAGQQDTYLNIIGKEAIINHISKCWASLFTERAVIYRMQNGFEHRQVHLAVVVQQMILPYASGILFTADPVTSNRKIVSIDAGFGLGESLVGGLVNADNYQVRDGRITAKNIPAKELAVYAMEGGGTKEYVVGSGQQNNRVLTDEQVLQLEHIGRKIEKHFGCPQDIEWCLANDIFYIVQSRPITTLFPIPEANEENHVFISVGHQQMMTDAMKPLGLSLWQLTAARPMYSAAGRLFVDIAKELASPSARLAILNGLGKSDPLIKDALMTILDRSDFIKTQPDGAGPAPGKSSTSPTHIDYQALNEYDPAVVDDLIQRSRESLHELKQNIGTKSGTELIDFILDDAGRLRQQMFGAVNFGIIMTIMNASFWINEKMQEWLGEKNAVDMLTQSVPGNITSEMGLELLEVADEIRPYPEVIAYLQQTKEEDFLDKLPIYNGGREVRDTINAYLDKYGMRCAGEIDITRPRWQERPGILIPILLGHIKNFNRGESKRKFESGLQQAQEKERELTERLEQLPDGAQKAAEAKRMIGLVRRLAGYREYPKYDIVNRYYIYKKTLLREAGRLVREQVIRKQDDIYYLSFEELHEMIRTGESNNQLINERKEKFKVYERLNPPRVITSDGEIITGSYSHENLPPKAIAGLAVSSGIIEGRARVILNMEDAAPEEGDILVTRFTDPSWTPLFVSIKGLVTEVGGLMTHGAVIAREYGLPAVVGVEHATVLIRDGQRIRVNGTDGYIEIL